MTDLNNSSPTETEQEIVYKVEELFLLHLRYKAALLEKLGNNAPIILDDPSITWVVYAGWVDIFAVPLNDGKVDGARKHLFRVSAGQALFGMYINSAVNNIGLLAVGSNNTSLLKVASKQLQSLGRDEEFGDQVASLVEHWVKNLSNALAVTLPPKTCIPLSIEEDAYVLRKSDTASASRGVLWVKHMQGKSYFMGNKELPVLNGTLHWPISNRTWLQAAEPSQLKIIQTSPFIRNQPDGFGLEPFHEMMLRQLALWIKQNKIGDRERLHSKIESNQEIVEDAFAGLAVQFIAPKSEIYDETAVDNPLLAACRIIGDRLGIEIQEPPTQRQGNHYDPLAEIARASRFQIRRVALKGEWWQQDNGPLITYHISDEVKQPVALLPKTNKGYELFNSQTSQSQIVDETVALTLDSFAYMFYRPFPTKALNLLDLVRFGLQNTGYDLRNMLLYGLGMSLLGLLIPVATGLIVDTIIPNGDRGQLMQIGFLLIFAAIATTLLRITQNIAMLRLQGNMGTSIQAAMWDRLLSLPVSFFRDFTAGDLGDRVMGIAVIERTMSGTVIQALLSGLFSVTSFLLLYYYDGRLAVMATFLVALAVGVTVFAGRVQVRYQRTLVDIQGKLSGIVLQTITGIAKFRAAGVEGHAFASWAKDFSVYKQAGFKARETANNLVVFNSAFPLITSMFIFGMVAFSTQTPMSTGTFLAFNVTFIQFLTAVLALSQAYVAILNIVPTYERVKPIIKTLPEVDEMKADPSELTGEIEVSHVSFRYQEDGPLILKDVSLSIEPGEFVALVGSSGSGKSTLLRLLLGFEMSESGAVYYNGHDLSGLDVREVRRQLGVVLQDGKVMTGDIFTNIIGSSLLTIEDAWEAARMAGLDDDIKAMPMGMHTVISEGGGTLSGGQRQRLLIARSLVNKPRIILFDEATSALDNHTQAVVSESLENLKATRVVIAHRLSTIMNADKIFVLENGRVVQQGTYKELVQQDGIFAELAKRQMA